MTRFILFTKGSSDRVTALKTSFFSFFKKSLATTGISRFAKEIYEEIDVIYFLILVHRANLKKLNKDARTAVAPSGWIICYYVGCQYKIWLIKGFSLAFLTTIWVDLIYPFSPDRLASVHEVKAGVEVVYQQLQDPQIPATPEQTKEISDLKFRLVSCVVITVIGFTVAVVIKAADLYSKGHYR